VLILRIKQCERALADGRLDEAYDLARRPDVRTHRRGQELVQEIVRALIERGRKHLAQGCLPAAAADADKAVQLGGNLHDAVQLREAVRTAQRSVDCVNQQAAQAIALARRHADQGQLTVGQRVLAESPVADARLNGLKQDLAARRAGLDSAAQKATKAFDAGDWEAAIDQITATGRAGIQDVSLRQLSDRITDHVAKLAAPQIEAGRLDTAAALLQKLAPLRTETTARQELRSTLEECSAISIAVAAGRQQEAETMLLRLQKKWPKAAWIAELSDQIRHWGQVQAALRTSPLLLLNPSSQVAPINGAAKPNLPPIMQPPRLPPSREESFVLHVDGVGSFRILPGPNVHIGPLSSTRPLDLPLMIDATTPLITLSRSDEDYFLSAEKPVTVNEVPRTTKLLATGDRIALGPRCRLTFKRPIPASGTAVLEVSGARLPNAGIRQVILMDREIVIGPSASAHIRADDVPAPVILLRGPVGWSCRSNAEIKIDGRSAGNSCDLLPGANVAVGSLGFVISREVKP
jgi:hypothetical protein